ncbi:hypothetical protein [uncultured Desulfovibrio sp.]|uniref:hypothetical protein n=1 Tax=uncultured Desulfovibrio sp. TaxID=167968 RepID=UPI00261480F4|nr:hypothetical protein [uncultured Desulfovibrio sp.]
MLKPFYQGKLDTFCAIYAVLNALRLTHGIRTTRARDILNETLMALAGNPEALRAVLTQETDYLQLVDGILRAQKHKFPLDVQAPWDEQAQPDENEFWTACRRWLDGGTKRAIIFRFLRHMTPDGPAVNRHWTVADRINDSVLHLFDCSHEAEAILNVHRVEFVTHPSRIATGRLLFIEPRTVRFIRLPF